MSWILSLSLVIAVACGDDDGYDKTTTDYGTDTDDTDTTDTDTHDTDTTDTDTTDTDTTGDTDTTDTDTTDTDTTDTDTTDTDTTDTGSGAPTPPALTMSVLASGLENPFEVLLGNDGFLWVTERSAGRVTRVSTVDGSQHVALTLADVLVTPGAQNGLMGMAFDGAWGQGGADQLYLAYTYDADAGPDEDGRVRIVRYTWDAVAETLGSPKVLLEGLPASHDHDSGRLLWGPDGKLYYSIGDQGKNQLSYYCDENEAQRLPTAGEVTAGDWSAYQGKILRIAPDGAIPNDNPTFGGVQSHVWTVGHRNPQGLAFGPNGELYEAEHGPKTDDEINLLEAGMNYGWPYVAGYQDDQSYVYANWSASTNPACEDLVYDDIVIPPSVPTQDETAWAAPATFREPLRTFYTVANGYDFTDPLCDPSGVYFICWPTIAPSSIAIYSGIAGGDPYYDGSIFVTSLKLGALYRLDLADADPVALTGSADPELVWQTVDRYRRVTFSADGQKIYVATDSSGYTSAADGTPTTVLEHPGAILELDLQ